MKSKQREIVLDLNLPDDRVYRVHWYRNISYNLNNRGAINVEVALVPYDDWLKSQSDSSIVTPIYTKKTLYGCQDFLILGSLWQGKKQARLVKLTTGKLRSFKNVIINNHTMMSNSAHDSCPFYEDFYILPKNKYSLEGAGNTFFTSVSIPGSDDRHGLLFHPLTIFNLFYGATYSFAKAILGGRFKTEKDLIINIDKTSLHTYPPFISFSKNFHITKNIAKKAAAILLNESIRKRALLIHQKLQESFYYNKSAALDVLWPWFGIGNLDVQGTELKCFNPNKGEYFSRFLVHRILKQSFIPDIGNFEYEAPDNQQAEKEEELDLIHDYPISNGEEIAEDELELEDDTPPSNAKSPIRLESLTVEEPGLAEVDAFKKPKEKQTAINGNLPCEESKHPTNNVSEGDGASNFDGPAPITIIHEPVVNEKDTKSFEGFIEAITKLQDSINEHHSFFPEINFRNPGLQESDLSIKFRERLIHPLFFPTKVNGKSYAWTSIGKGKCFNRRLFIVEIVVEKKYFYIFESERDYPGEPIGRNVYCKVGFQRASVAELKNIIAFAVKKGGNWIPAHELLSFYKATTKHMKKDDTSKVAKRLREPIMEAVLSGTGPLVTPRN